VSVGETVTEKASKRAPRDSVATRSNILDVATRHFAAKGYSGARIDEIAADTATSKRMIYYYFADKEALFIAVLEHVYKGMREHEACLNLNELEPRAAIAALVGYTFDYQNEHADFIRLVMIENIHCGRHLLKSRAIRALNISVIAALEEIYARGLKDEIFQPGIDIIDLHWAISALCFFNVSNRHTFSIIFQKELSTAEALAARKAQAVEIVLAWLAGSRQSQRDVTIGDPAKRMRPVQSGRSH
jgi:AcrR family transcriptional regulator